MTPSDVETWSEHRASFALIDTKGGKERITGSVRLGTPVA
jgi:hypothetical protein